MLEKKRKIEFRSDIISHFKIFLFRNGHKFEIM